MADTINVGDAAPEFVLPGVVTKPEVFRQQVRLSDYKGKKNVVVVFHPFAFTAT